MRSSVLAIWRARGGEDGGLCGEGAGQSFILQDKGDRGAVLEGDDEIAVLAGRVFKFGVVRARGFVSKLSLCELFGIDFCALFGIIGTYSRTRHGRTGIAGSIRS
jgi:hypothetical protein